VEQQKKVMILTDNSDSIQPIANSIAAVIGDYPRYQTAIINAEEFKGVELLPTCAFFLGCENPKPPSFAYIEDMLEHINLAGRPCGIFSSNSGAIQYLSVLVKASEAAVDKPFLTLSGKDMGEELQKWVRSVVEMKA
jgi:hypothetical protein